MDNSDSDTVDGPTSQTAGDNKRRTFTPAVKQYLVRWLLRYKENPYPSPRIKQRLANHTGLSVSQIEDFFVNGIWSLYRSQTILKAWEAGYKGECGGCGC
jgi:Homeobox KN domain